MTLSKTTHDQMALAFAVASLQSDTLQPSPCAGCGSPQSKLQQNRARNREHARRTRLRKKAELEELQLMVQGLQKERDFWTQRVQDCAMAGILLELREGASTSPGESDEENRQSDENTETMPPTMLEKGRRRRFPAMSSINKSVSVEIDGRLIRVFGEKGTQVNWKTGIYRDESGEHVHLSASQLQTLRRERNRMHAKLTRDRRKSFIATLYKSVAELQGEISRLKERVSQASPTLAPQPNPASTSEIMQHGFSLDG